MDRTNIYITYLPILIENSVYCNVTHNNVPFTAKWILWNMDMLFCPFVHLDAYMGRIFLHFSNCPAAKHSCKGRIKSKPLWERKKSQNNCLFHELFVILLLYNHSVHIWSRWNSFPSKSIVFKMQLQGVPYILDHFPNLKLILSSFSNAPFFNFHWLC